MMRTIQQLFFVLVMLVGGGASAQVAVAVEGRVAHPGVLALTGQARLLDALRAADVQPDAYLLGAAWLHRDAIAAQRELKVGLLFDLAVVEQAARLEGKADLGELAGRLADRVRAQPVTGRRTDTLDPVRVELEARSNRRLGDGDRLVFPSRPVDVTVTGAVQADCVLPFVGLRSATQYRSDCPLHPHADPDWLYIVQPDGQVLRRGVALWNQDRDQALAPGARLVVPLSGKALRGRAEGLNEELAGFLATQPVPSAESAR
ncbi:capsule biosynthesis GfcC family protein [Azoarcus sp. KH32C]|uniref:capsule biosynthesis GfcC family protein n=1 Tax=Azoarcus sp. KH32C TaxID=748247 RepID=UPI0002386911|nr:capsule biosynthesis GfcC family protein [Azoarcus sp. KH32C]BAL23228.1 hypothetical protein AZKH_0892 [Azoarcus sp. KH32C]